MDLSIFLAILVISLSIIFIGVLLSRYVYKRIKGLPTGDCAYCKKNVKKILKQYRKQYSK